MTVEDSPEMTCTADTRRRHVRPLSVTCMMKLYRALRGLVWRETYVYAYIYSTINTYRGRAERLYSEVSGRNRE